MKTEYLLFNAIVGMGSFIAVYTFRRHSLFPKLLPAIYAILVAASLFIALDQVVTNSWWYFNPRHILGLTVGALPVEEIMFFFSIPFACLLLWVNIRRLHTHKLSDKTYKIVVFSVWTLVLLIFGLSRPLPYTRFVLVALACVPLIDLILKTHLFKSSIFIVFVGGITNILTLLCNGYLTARPIVTYNPLMKSNLYVFTIPVEDFAYGIALIALVIMLYEFFARIRIFTVNSHNR